MGGHEAIGAYIPPKVRAAVYARDGMCVAAKLGFRHVCQTQFRRPHGPDRLDLMEVDHVGERRTGKAAPSRVEFLVTLCGWTHHEGWATAHRPELRDYLDKHHPERLQGARAL